MDSDRENEDKCPTCLGEQRVYEPQRGDKRVLYFPGLVDIVVHEGRLKFLVKGCDGSGGIVDHYHHPVNGNNVVVPPDGIRHILVSDGVAIVSHYDSETGYIELFSDVRSFVKRHVELPSVGEYDVVSYWLMHTYLIETFSHSPYLLFLGPPDSGKSRALEVLRSLAYRGYFVVDPSSATIYHMADEEKVTLVIDEANTLYRAAGSNMRAILNVRFQRQGCVPRRNPDNTETEHFAVYGATALASTQDVDEVLKTRTLTIHMEQATRNVAEGIDADFAKTLRERLLAFRLRFLGEELPRPVLKVKHRLKDMAKPLYSVNALLGKRRGRLDEYFGSLDKERSMERTQSLDADILRAIAGLVVTGKINDGLFFTCDVASGVNWSRSEGERLTEAMVGRKISALGFGIAGSRTYGGRSRKARHFDGDRFERLRKRFGIEMPEGSE